MFGEFFPLRALNASSVASLPVYTFVFHFFFKNILSTLFTSVSVPDS